MIDSRPAARPAVSLRRSATRWIRGGAFFSIVCGLTYDDRSTLTWEQNDRGQFCTVVDGVQLRLSGAGGGDTERHSILWLGKSHCSQMARFRCNSTSISKLLGAEAVLSSITDERWAKIIATEVSK